MTMQPKESRKGDFYSLEKSFYAIIVQSWNTCQAKFDEQQILKAKTFS